MLCIVVALKAEIEWFIERYGLVKEDDPHFLIFSNSSFRVIISGVGIINCALATTYLLSQTKRQKRVINFGICGAKSEIEISEVYQIKKVVDLCSKKSYLLDGGEIALSSSPSPVKNEYDFKTPLVDMEASGFLLAAKKFVNIEKIRIVKIVSDHLNEVQMTRDKIETLIEKKREKVLELLC